ncbi:MAG: DUF1749 domain-containing protein [Nanoarchaeota archaeon]|mgnify:CR=1 FL=1
MKCSIIEVETSDSLPLFGLYNKVNKSKTILISIHGTASNFYENYFMTILTEQLSKKDVSSLSTNNRGTSVYQIYPRAGAAIEHFEDCLLDIDAWISYALAQGYKNIILQGHSLGAEKIVYYMSKGKYVKNIKAVILLGPADSYGYTTECCLDKKELKDLIEEAKILVSKGNKEVFLRKKWLSHGNVLPKGADSFLNFFTPNSELSKTLPLRQGKDLKMYQNIKVPILVAIGDQKEPTVIPISKALEVLKKENKFAECIQIKDCNHDFEEKEEELTKIILTFLTKNKI